MVNYAGQVYCTRGLPESIAANTDIGADCRFVGWVRVNTRIEQ